MKPFGVSGSLDALFVTGYTETARDLVLVADELRTRGWSIAFTVHNKKSDLIRVISDSGFEVVSLFDPELSLQDMPGNDSRAGVAPESTVSFPKPSFRRAVRRLAEASGVAKPGLEFLNQSRALRAATNIIDHFEPGVVVMDADSVTPAIQVAHVARKRDLASVCVQSSILSPPQFIAERNVNIEKSRNGGESVLEKTAARVVRKRWPSFVQSVEGKPVLNVFGPFPILVGAMMGVLPISNWLQFGGAAQAYAVSGDQARKVLVEYGIEPDRIYVCGQPRMDLAVKMAGLDYGESLARRQGGVRLRVLLATAPWERYGVMSRDAKMSLVRSAAESMVGVSDEIDLQVKLHPLEPDNEYRHALSGIPRCNEVNREEDIIDLIAQCDAFVTQVSSSAHFAIAAGRPVVTFNFDGRSIFNKLHNDGLSVHANNSGELREVIRMLLDEDCVNRLQLDQRHSLQKKVRIDGRAAQTIADLVERQSEYKNLPWRAEMKRLGDAGGK